MSKNRSRAKYSKALTSKEYNSIMIDELYPLYWDEGLRFYDKKYHCWSKRPTKRLLYYQIRMYKTWKHNRKTQWKNK